jgi:two-component system LytT family sensor kinase
MTLTETDCFSVDVYLASELIGFTAGLIVSVLFLVLTLRAVRLPGTPLANVALALCALTWNFGGLAKAFTTVLGVAFPSGTVNWPATIMFTGMWLWPVPVLAIWLNHSARRWQQLGCCILQATGGLAALGVLSFHLAPGLLAATGLSSDDFMGLEKQLFSGYGLALLAFGTAMLVQDRPKSRAAWIAYVMILLGIFGSALTLLLHQTLSLGPEFDTAFAILSKKSAMLVLFGSFFLFARFRFADVFIRHSVRILLASGLATGFVKHTQWSVWPELAARTASPAATQLFILCLLATVLILCFVVLDRLIMRLLTKWLFAVPDYRAVTQRLGETIGALHHETEIIVATEDAMRTTLDLREAKVLPFAAVPAVERFSHLAAGEVVELCAQDPLGRQLPVTETELLVPVCPGGHATHVLVLAPGQDRRALVSHEIAFLRTTAVQMAQRFDALRSERERIERLSREALLLQQVAEAELRALRAQINPHFLFNSLNTVADLVVTDPARAELMTLRLAQVFRHVLAHSSRPVTSIREEIDFVRTYLFIEEARFGDRLRVEINIAPEVAGEKIPSLILQPLVENALKHGLGPKIGTGHLRIDATARKDHVCLTVADDGLGPGASKPALPAGDGRVASTGVGLKNVAERLRTLYRDRAGVRLEARVGGGSLVTILIPWATSEAGA